MEINFYIKSARQERALRALLKNAQGIPCRDLGEMIGACNAGQVVMEIREQCFYDIIITKSLKVRDRDGKICRPGLYYIPFEYREFVKKILEEYATRLAATKRVARENTVHIDHIISGGLLP